MDTIQSTILYITKKKVLGFILSEKFVYAMTRGDGGVGGGGCVATAGRSVVYMDKET